MGGSGAAPDAGVSMDAGAGASAAGDGGPDGGFPAVGSIKGMVGQPLDLSDVLAGLSGDTLASASQASGPVTTSIDVGAATFETWAAGTYVFDLTFSDGATAELTVDAWSITTNGTNSLVVKPDGTLWGWGENDYWDLAQGDNTDYARRPITIGSDSDWARVSAGYDYVLGLKNDGTVWVWGGTYEGESGTGTQDAELFTPTAVCGLAGSGDAGGGCSGQLSGIRKIVAGYYTSMALSETGALYAWGSADGAGRLGRGLLDDRALVPSPVCAVDYAGAAPCTVGSGDLTGVVDFGMSQNHAVALLDGGDVVAWGRNGNVGLLGINHDDINSVAVPRRVCAASDGAALNTDCSTFMTGTRISTGDAASYVLGSGGQIYAWGYNSDGQLGIDSLTTAFKPDAVAAPGGGAAETDWVAVWGGHSSAFGKKSDGSMWAWGRNDRGAVPNGKVETTGQTTPSAMCAVGVSYPCEPGSGRELYDLHGIASDLWNDPVNLAIHPTRGIVRWGYQSTYNGAAGDIYSYFANGGLGIVENVSPTPGTVLAEGAEAPSAGWTAVSSNERHVLALDDGGGVWAWGSNEFGQLGTGDAYPRATPARVCAAGQTPPCASYLEGVSQIAAGSGFSLALKTDGTVVSWGHNDRGKLGVGDTTDRSIPTAVCEVGETAGSCSKFLSNIVAISASERFALALRDDDSSNANLNGQVLAWGGQQFGVLGDGVTTDTSLSVPIEVAGVGGTGTLSGITAIAAGREHSLAAGGPQNTAYAWGNSGLGRLGNGDATPNTTGFATVVCTALEEPCVSPLTGIVQLAATRASGYARSSGGALYSWGSEYFGGLGDGTVDGNSSGVHYARVVPGLATNVIDVAVHRAARYVGGLNASMGYAPYALVQSGTDTTVFAWGRGLFYATGQPSDTSDIATATPVCAAGATNCATNPLTGVRSLGAGIGAGYAVMNDGTIQAWGTSYDGVLGFAPGANVVTPWPMPPF